MLAIHFLNLSQQATRVFLTLLAQKEPLCEERKSNAPLEKRNTAFWIVNHFTTFHLSKFTVRKL